MVHRKVKHKIIGYACFCLIVLFACKKEAKEPIGAKIYAVMAHNGQPISGIRWKVVEFEAKGFSGDIGSTGWEENGETDGAGISLIEFHPKKDLDFIYDIYFDYSSMSVSQGDYSIVSGHTGFDRLVREYMTAENTYEIRILPIMDVQFNFKNENCYGSTDTFRYKNFNIDEEPNLSQGQIDGRPWLEGSSLNGCVDFTGPFATRLAGHYVFYWEAIRDGTLETGLDTFYVSPDGNNLIEMFW